MPLLPIMAYPHAILRKTASPITHVDETIQQLAQDMLETMYDAGGIGLAANQVNSLLRIFVVDISEEKDQPQVFINPRIIQKEGQQEGDEGCLSFVGVYSGPIERAAKITVTALNEYGEPFEIKAEKLLATCIQHEIDHLNGIMFIDHLSALKRDIALKKYKKKQKEDAA